MKSFLRRRVLPTLVYWIYRAWTASWRQTIVESAGLQARLREGRPVIFAHWHGDELAIVQFVPRYRIATMTSTSEDGSLIDQVILKLGGATSRGSSTRGGIAALKGLIRLLKTDHNASMAVDGPKGPLHKVKPGVFELARVTGAAIVPMGVSASNAIVFKKSWNKAQLPKPFSRVAVVFADPWELSRDGLDTRSQSLADQLADRLSDAGHQAAKLIARDS